MLPRATQMLRCSPARFARLMGLSRNLSRNARSSRARRGSRAGGAEVVALPKGGLQAIAGLPVHGAHVLADVAAEDPVADQRPQLPGYGPAELYGQERDAPGVVDDVGRNDRACRAGVDAPDAIAAGLGQGLVGLKVQVGDDLRQQHPRAVARRQDVGVLAEPADAGARGRGPVVHRPVVHEYARLHWPVQPLRQTLDETPQPLLDNAVVVVTPGVACHLAGGPRSPGVGSPVR